MNTSHHQPVLLDEVLAAASDAGRIVDGTLGDGGHAEALTRTGAELLGVDRDPEAIRRAGARLAGRAVTLVQGGFDDPPVLERARQFAPGLVLLDLGVSSRQFDDETLGFSFRPGTLLDMRMSQHGETAAGLLARLTAGQLAGLLADLADEPRPRARRLAREIVRRREREPLTISDHLVNAIRAVLGPSSGPADFARIFQAVRIAVNDELGRLQRALDGYLEALRPGGALAVISYHSGEDRIVKQAFREWARACICPREWPVCRCRGRPLGTLETRRPIRPTDAEVADNPRARSARLRIFRKA